MERRGVRTMKTGTPIDRRTIATQRLSAANDEAAFDAPRQPHQITVTGWDPYEVWRTRVKAPQERSGEPRRHSSP